MKEMRAKSRNDTEGGATFKQRIKIFLFSLLRESHRSACNQLVTIRAAIQINRRGSTRKAKLTETYAWNMKKRPDYITETKTG